ncbi:MAG: sugar ABC transporter permease [Dictyoglomus sp. NZ13-RE01]|nr:MAG: sugar ABC transporter permease [Dictyoglomus sp. NZ13-RE01]
MKVLGGIPKSKQAQYFVLFTILSFIFAALSYYIPFIMSFRLALSEYDAVTPPKFIGLENFRRILNDKVFWISLKNSFLYSLYVVPSVIILSFLIAVGLNREGKFIKFLRTLYFLPTVSATVAIAFVWAWFYQPEYGLLNTFLRLFGFKTIYWLTDKRFALPALAIAGIWGGLSYNIILFLAGLQNIPSIYYEAASLDGAKPKDILFHITIPLMTPIIFFVLIMEIIGTVQMFEAVFILTRGGPGYATHTLVYYIYRNGFNWFRMGYGVAISWVLYFILLILTIIQFRLQKRWVYYE